MMNKKRFACLFVAAAGAVAAEPSLQQMAEDFDKPGNSARPRAYWNWMNGDVTLEGLSYDLEQAKAKGMAGLEIWDTGALRHDEHDPMPAGPPFMGEHSVKAIQHCMREAERLDLSLGLITSSGWNAGGPWVPPALASKNLFVSEQVLEGPSPVKVPLAMPELPEECPRDEAGNPRWSQEVAVLAWPETPDKRIAQASQIIHLSDRFKDGVLEWQVPEGKWRVARFVCSNNGQQLIAASPNSLGPFIDFLDPEATRFHFEYILDKIGIKKGATDSPMKRLALDSMELYPGIQWTPKLPQWFRQARGYDPLPWLPALAGWTVIDEETSGRFRYDFSKVISDLLIFSHYTTGSRVCGEYGLKLVAEAGGPGPPIWDTCPVDSLKALGHVDIPRGEFWVGNRHDIFLIKEIASASHIYGRKIVDAESWTTWKRWNVSPFECKQWADRAFCEGLNRITQHVFPHSKAGDGYPGRNYHAGIDINPRSVWWSKARPFMDYLSRCSALLQQGSFVADVAYFYGDQAPNFWPLPANCPDSPKVPGLSRGYDYDVVNSEVILSRMAVADDGRIVLPDGLSYRVLVLPKQDHMPLEVLRKLQQMVHQGASILGPKPGRVPGLHEHQRRTAELQGIAQAMWGDAASGVRKVGKGSVAWGMTPDQWLEQHGVSADFADASEPAADRLRFIHRRTAHADIYFVSNRTLESVESNCRFRVSGRTPMLWRPEDGSLLPVKGHQQDGDHTKLALSLPPGGSIFVVFADAGQIAPLQAAIDQAAANMVGSAGKSLPLKGPWKVSFDAEWGGPGELEMADLISWTESQDEGLKHYSGTGTYRRTLELDEPVIRDGRRVFIDLGDVREVAEVHLNGKSAGILWKPPYVVELTAHLKPGANDLKIEVMNQWINRLVGDMQLPPEKRFTRTNVRQGQDWELRPAGLLGPVNLKLVD